MNDQDKLKLVALSLCKGFGNARLLKVLTQSIPPSQVLAHPMEYQQALGLKASTIELINQKHYQTNIDKTQNWLSKPNHHLLAWGEEAYPIQLMQIENPPAILYAVGDISLLSQPQLAIVGTRKFSAYGKSCTEYFSQGLAEAGYIITSGLAEGIDTLAHQGALQAKGKTVAVVGTGIDIVYPARNRQLAQAIVGHSGLIISEFPLGTAPERHNFPMRNRIISGLSQGTLVIECAEKSGSLITAQLALEQNREVFAVPGNIFHSTSGGCHSLIRQGAKIATCIQDILEELHLPSPQADLLSGISTTKTKPAPTNKPEIDSPILKSIYDHLSDNRSTLDELITKTALNYAELTTGLFELEMLGHIETIVGGYRRL